MMGRYHRSPSWAQFDHQGPCMWKRDDNVNREYSDMDGFKCRGNALAKGWALGSVQNRERQDNL